MKISAPLLLASSAAAAATGKQHVQRQSSEPSLKVAPDTTPYCSYWYDNKNGLVTCGAIPRTFLITAEEFLRWNPSVGADCKGYQTGNSYCIEAWGEPEPQPTTSSSSSSSSSTSTTSTSSSTSSTPTPVITPTPTPTPVNPGNGIETPAPIQPGMVSNCDAFYFVKSGDNCETIAGKSGITLSQFLTWNPQVGGNSCNLLWADAYVCVSTIGHTPGPTTTTSAGNGIATPQPTQPGIVNNCDSFYYVNPGDTCDTISAKSGITVAQFRTWNTQVGSNCGGLWANAYACISIVGHTPTPVTPGNGVTTPVPIQSGMVSNCKTFHFVQSGETCATIAAKYRISVAQFVSWNPAVKSDCTGMWANTNACVGLI